MEIGLDSDKHIETVMLLRQQKPEGCIGAELDRLNK